MAVLREFRIAVRALRRNATFSVLSVLTLALGIGAITAIFSVVDAVVRQPLPYPDAHELLRLGTEMTDGRQTSGGISPFALEGIAAESRTIERAAGSFQVEIALRDRRDRPLPTDAYLVSEGFFDVLGKPMLLGRGFEAREHAAPPHSIVLSHRLWTTAFDPSRRSSDDRFPSEEGP